MEIGVADEAVSNQQHEVMSLNDRLAKCVRTFHDVHYREAIRADFELKKLLLVKGFHSLNINSYEVEQRNAIVISSQNVENLNNQLKSLRILIDNESTSNDDRNRKIEKLHCDIVNLEQEMNKNKIQMNAYQSDVRGIKLEISHLVEEISVFKKFIPDEEQRIVEEQKRLNFFKSQIANLIRTRLKYMESEVFQVNVASDSKKFESAIQFTMNKVRSKFALLEKKKKDALETLMTRRIQITQPLMVQHDIQIKNVETLERNFFGLEEEKCHLSIKKKQLQWHIENDNSQTRSALLFIRENINFSKAEQETIFRSVQHLGTENRKLKIEIERFRRLLYGYERTFAATPINVERKTHSAMPVELKTPSRKNGSPIRKDSYFDPKLQVHVEQYQFANSQIEIVEIDPEGKFITLANAAGTQPSPNLEGWTVTRTFDDRPPVTCTLGTGVILGNMTMKVYGRHPVLLPKHEFWGSFTTSATVSVRDKEGYERARRIEKKFHGIIQASLV